jgi:hypothetical protein
LDKGVLYSKVKDPHDPQIVYRHRKCIPDCSIFTNYTQLPNNRCIRKEPKPIEETAADKTDVEFDDIEEEDMVLSLSALFVSIFGAILFSFILLSLFRYATKYVVWFIYFGIVILFLIIALFLLVLKSMGPAIFMGVIGLVLAIVLCCFMKQIKSVIRLFKETATVLFDVPMLLFLPTLSFLALLIGTIVFGYLFAVTMVSGKITPVYNSDGNYEKAEFQKNKAMVMSCWVTGLGYFIFTSIISGCQDFIIACTVSQWYFTRSKHHLDSPITRSFSILWQYHLGSICLGSIIMLAVKIIRIILAFLTVKIYNELYNSNFYRHFL